MAHPSRLPLLAALLAAGLVASLLVIPPASVGAEEQDAAADFLVGAASVSADPDPGERICLGGYALGCKRPMKGIADPLRTSAIAVTGGNELEDTIIIVKTTAFGLFASYKPEQGETGIYQVRQRIAAKTGISAGQIVVTSDHSHAAPDTIGISGGLKRSYMELLAESMVSAATDAYAARRPAELSVGTATGPALESAYSQGPTNSEAMDEEFRVLFARSPEGEPIATLVNYAPHATVCGRCDDMATGDWTAWAAQEIEALGLGVGIGFVGAVGAADWGPQGQEKDQEEARQRLRALLEAASNDRIPVEGNTVAADRIFIREQLAQPVFGTNVVPGGVPLCPPSPQDPCDDRFGIDRDTRAPWLSGGMYGTYAGALRIGDVFISTIPGEPFPQLQEALRDSVTGASAHFMLGAADDFLGYMTLGDDEYRQTLEEGATFAAGCPEEEVTHQLPGKKDGACPGHWTLMVSPTIGRHAVCTVQNAAENIGFGIARRNERCAALTALDGLGAPKERAGDQGSGSEPEDHDDGDEGSESEDHDDDDEGSEPEDHDDGDEGSEPEDHDDGDDEGSEPEDHDDDDDEGSEPEDHDDDDDEGSEPEDHDGRVSRAGVAVVKAPWHIGASGGQFSDTEIPVSEDSVDPYGHSTKKRPSYGLGSDVEVKALVVEGSDGEKVAIVSHDLYLPQDLLTRRIGTLVEEATGIPARNVMVTASHNHNSAYYSTPSWGAWLFQDVMDLRFFEYMAQRASKAVIDANAGLVPVRMGGSTSSFNEITTHTYGPKVADDGTPAGQPYDYTTGQVTTVAFDELLEDGGTAPLATWVVFGVHPEWTWGYDLLNGDIATATTRIVDREVGGVTIWSGREMGTSGPHKGTRVHEPEERREYQDNGFAEVDRAARLLATAIEDTRSDIASGTPEMADRFSPYQEGFEVAVASQRFAPPSTRPYPGISNCNTRTLMHGDPAIPVLGLPDCSSPRNPPGETGPLGQPIGDAVSAVGDAYGPIGGTMYEELKKAGVPIPESYSATKLTGVEETAAVHLMAIKLGDIGVTACPCEQFTDTALNIESRIDRTPDNLRLGFDWTDQQTPTGRDWCIRNADSTWTCANPQDPTTDLPPVEDLAYRRMVAQIENDAAGWETDLATLGSEAEPYEPDEIKGNFTHEEFPENGFALPIAVGMANDYWGYVPEYREYRAFDSYRKALSGLGPHGADFLATRLSRLAASLNGAPGPELRPIDLAFQAESARAQIVADGLGELAGAYEKVYVTQLPPDGGSPQVISGPETVQRFSGANLRWIGGSTYAEMPRVVVQRRTESGWEPFADTTGEIQLTVRFPRFDELDSWRAGEFEWEWAATFEAFGSDISWPDASGESRRATPAGEYRFVVEGERRTLAGATEPYELTHTFTVEPWDGIVVKDMRAETDGLSFEVGSAFENGSKGVACPGKQGRAELGDPGPIDLPDSYSDSPFRYIKCEWRVFKYDLDDASRWQSYCSFCSFRPWADTARVDRVLVTVRRAGGATEEVVASERGGRWFANVTLYAGDVAYVDSGGVVDEFGNVNGKRSSEIEGTGAPPVPPI